ncbi:hypothetical protein M1328_01035 [Patescibacteria group bacterium]|nr:hypothetical protein [Patescibacteria group bacterium]
MKKYVFQVTSSIFQASRDVQYNELEHKILNEKIDGIEIVIKVDKLDDVNNKIEENLKEIIVLNFLDYPNIKNYKFKVKVVKIEEL